MLIRYLVRQISQFFYTEYYYKTLYESSIAFGIRKALQAEQGKTDMENYISKLEEGKTGLEKEVNDGKMVLIVNTVTIVGV